MSKYGQYCPVAKSLEILGDRWTLLIIREFLIGMSHFNDLERGLPGISRPLLAQRLRQLQKAGIVEKLSTKTGRQSTAYQLTPAGWELQKVMDGLMLWGEAWAFSEPTPEELDPVLLMWRLRNDVRKERLPESRVVVQYDFRVRGKGYFWLVLTQADVTLCLTDPGYEVNVWVSADLAIFYKMYWGRITYSEALQNGVKVEGIAPMVEAFPEWFAWNSANGIRAVRAARELRLNVVNPSANALNP